MDEVQFPFVSIILPVRNEATYIQRSLGAILAQNYPSDLLEVLVVDGMSSDGTREMVQKMSTRSKFPIRLIDNSDLITPVALNKGFRESKGDVIVRVDGHCEIMPDYVKRCVLHLQRNDVSAVGGAIETGGDSYLARAIAIAMSTTFGVGNSLFRTTKGNKQVFTDSVPFPAYKREVINRLGQYDELMLCNEDDEYNYRLLKSGGKILLDNDIVSRYYSRVSLYSLWRQYFRYGFWKVRILQKHPLQMRIRQFVPFIFVATLLFLVIGVIVNQLWLIPFIIMFGMYFLLSIIASIVAVSKRNWSYVFPLPLIFLILHMSYGIGFLFGLVKFTPLWGKP